MKKLILTIDGMSCSACVKGVDKALNAVAGVTFVQVDLAAGRAEVHYDVSQTTATALTHAVDDAGFEAGVLNDGLVL